MPSSLSFSNDRSSSFCFLESFARRFDRDLDIEIAGHAAAPHHGHAFAADAELFSRLRRFRNGDLAPAAIAGRHFDQAAQRRGNERDRCAAIKVVSIALENLVRRNRDEDVEIARRPAIHTRLAFAGETDARAFLDTGRNADRERTLFLHMTRTAAAAAGIADGAARAPTIGAGALDGEEALLRADFAAAGTRRALLGLGARLGAGARAGFARDRGVDANLFTFAAISVFQGDFEIVAQVAAAVLPPCPLATHEFAEQIVEHIGEGGGEIEAETVGALPPPVLECGMAVAIVSRALLIVLQDFISFRDFLEADLGAVIAVIAVGMMFLGKLAIGALDLFDRGAFRTSQNFVVIALAHDRKSEHGTGESESAEQIHRFPSPVSVFDSLIMPRPFCRRRLLRTSHRRHCRPAWAGRRPRDPLPLHRPAAPCTSPRPASSKLAREHPSSA